MENKEEIWKDIIGYEGLYKISSLGNVASVDRYVKSPLHKTGVRIHYGKQLKIDIPRAGSRYITFKVSSNGKSKTLILHREVAKLFIDNPLNLPYVNHKNRNSFDNRAENLEWVSPRSNSLHYLSLTQNKKPTGVFKNGNLYQTRMYINGVNTHIGSYKSEKEASFAYHKKLIELNESISYANII